MTSPLFSIAMPVRNGSNYLAAALDSIAAQTFGDFELIASDNASTDTTPDILKNYCDRNPQFRCSRSETLLPVVENFNRAGSMARGKWVVFLGHDDALRPNCLSRLAEAFAEHGNGQLGLVSFAEDHLFANGFVGTPPKSRVPPLRYYAGRGFLRRKLSGRGPAALPGMSNAAVRRDVWESEGRFDPRFLHCDTFLWHQILLNYDYLVIAEPLVAVRIHDQQDSAAMRQQLRTIDEYRVFFHEFLREHGKGLALGPQDRVLAERRYLSVAATEIVIQILRRNPRRALDILKMIPWRLYPLVGALIVRNGVREAARTREVRRHVPARMLYPG